MRAVARRTGSNRILRVCVCVSVHTVLALTHLRAHTYTNTHMTGILVPQTTTFWCTRVPLLYPSWVYVRARACARLCVNVRVRVSGAVSSERLFVEGTLWSRTRSRCSLEISGV